MDVLVMLACSCTTALRCCGAHKYSFDTMRLVYILGKPGCRCCLKVDVDERVDQFCTYVVKAKVKCVNA